MKHFLSNIYRVLVLALAIIIQIVLQYFIITRLFDQLAWISAATRFLSFLITVEIVNNSRHLSSDMIWVIAVNVFPIIGTLVYLFFRIDQRISPTFQNIITMTEDAKRYYTQDERVMKQLAEEVPEKLGQFHYLSQSAGFPVYKNTGFEYYPMGEIGWPVMLEELKKAKKFIFLEYFILDKGTMWDSILEILEEKAKQGVEVRVLYDDLGSFFQLSSSYYKNLEAKGIKCIPFNRVSLLFNIILNHRDHRKIMVIDGKVAFSGGINLADEYINAIEKHGVWKDNCYKITGEAVWSYTVMFLTTWNSLRHEDQTFLTYRAQPIKGEQDGYIALYGDTPLDREDCGKNVIMNILSQAKDYVYIATPYLIIDAELINALILCARKGVDVRIITPGIPDKKIVFAITRSYYEPLIKDGVKIYRYDPGFVHAKIIVSDDTIATAGTVNFDYRSLYIHFENGSLLYRSSAVMDIKNDAISMMEAGHEVQLSECHINVVRRFLIAILRIFAPAM